jgi:PucR-like helix-turn-helix protein/diguanylate cyclase with GGDEF domain
MGSHVPLLRARLAGRMRARRAEIEQAVLSRAHAISDPAAATELSYVEGLRVAVADALDYGLAGIETGEEHAPPIPGSLLSQARLAARNRVSLDIVLRRYFAGYAMLGDLLVEEVERIESLETAELKRLLRSQASLFDRLLVAISDEYSREAAGRADTSEKHRAERVRRLLAGELLESIEFAYEFDTFHVGLVATGPGAAEALRELSSTFDRRLLLVRPDQQTVWAWLGGRRRPDLEEMAAYGASQWPNHAVLGIGEPAHGLSGWRLTHRQAAAALAVALRGSERVVRYASVALLSAALQDELLASSLHQIYLAPLEVDGDSGAALREALRAYFTADRNVSSTAAALGVSRRTVGGRLRAVEQCLGRRLSSVAAEMEVALLFEQLDDEPLSPRTI